MKSNSFHDILLAKMDRLEGVEAKPERSSLKYEAPLEFTLFDMPVRFFKAPKPSIKPPPPSVQTTPPPRPQTPPPPPERTFLKKDLSDEGRSKWNLFEKTFAVNLGEQTTVSRAMSAFRKYLKAHHPDLKGAQAAPQNFATLVKIKDELMAILKKS